MLSDPVSELREGVLRLAGDPGPDTLEAVVALAQRSRSILPDIMLTVLDPAAAGTLVLQLLSNIDTHHTPRWCGNVCFLVSALTDEPRGSAFLASLVSENAASLQRLLPELLSLITANDTELCMNACGLLSAIVESESGRGLVSAGAAHDRHFLGSLISILTLLLGAKDANVATNASLVLAHLTLSPDGCQGMTRGEEGEAVLKALVRALTSKVTGVKQNCAFCLGRLVAIPRVFNAVQSLPDNQLEKAMQAGIKMLNSKGSPELSRSACFLLMHMCNTSPSGHLALMKRLDAPVLLFNTLNLALQADSLDLSWMATLFYRAMCSSKFGFLLARKAPKMVRRIESFVQAYDARLPDANKSELNDIISMFQPPAAPGSFSLQMTAEFEARAKWDKVTANNCLPLSYHVIDLVTDTVVHDAGDRPGATFTLAPFTHFKLAVRAVTEADQSPPSSSVSVRTPESPPTEPMDVRVLATTFTEIWLNWAPPAFPNGVLRGYKLFKDDVLDGITHEQSYTFSHLTPGAPYALHVCAYNSAGPSRSVALSCSTQLKETVVFPPWVHVRGRTSLSVAWRPPANPRGQLTKYELLLHSAPVYSGTETSFTIPRLQPETDYTIQLAALTTEGRFFSDTIRARTTNDDYAFIPGTGPYFCKTPKIEAEEPSKLTKSPVSPNLRRSKTCIPSSSSTSGKKEEPSSGREDFEYDLSTRSVKTSRTRRAPPDVADRSALVAAAEALDRAERALELPALRPESSGEGIGGVPTAWGYSNDEDHKKRTPDNQTRRTELLDCNNPIVSYMEKLPPERLQRPSFHRSKSCGPITTRSTTPGKAAQADKADVPHEYKTLGAIRVSRSKQLGDEKGRKFVYPSATELYYTRPRSNPVVKRLDLFTPAETAITPTSRQSRRRPAAAARAFTPMQLRTQPANMPSSSTRIALL